MTDEHSAAAAVPDLPHRASRRRFLTGATAAGLITYPMLRSRAAPSDPGAPLAGPSRPHLVSSPFRRGLGGYEVFRVPVVLSTRAGTLLAFAEGRWRRRDADSGDINLLWRQSVDGGRSWGPLRIVLSHGADTAGNPCPVIDPGTGRVVLLSCRNHHDDTYEEIRAGRGVGPDGGARRVYVQHCDDPDDPVATWTPAREVTTVRRREWGWYATGPGAGTAITTGPHAGRLVFPASHTVRPGPADPGDGAGCHLVLSDDHGQTFRLGAVSSQPTGTVNEDEQAAVTLSDGRTLYASCRTGSSDTAVGSRADALSTDGGQTYAGVGLMRPQAAIRTVQCQGALLRLPDGRLVFSGPGPDGRAALALWVSDDEGNRGATWRHARTLDGRPAAYSSLTLHEGALLVLAEMGDLSPYDRIECWRVPIAELDA